MNKVIHLGKRLSSIADMLVQVDEYSHIWDCCCDHGYLGAYLLTHYSSDKSLSPTINFVDQVPHITQQLQDKLEQSTSSNYQVHTLNAEQLKFDKFSNHCIIIAGVTTTGTVKILKTLLKHHPTQSLDFILCPTREQYELRQFLIEQKLHLLDEKYLTENKRHYEVLHVRSKINTDENNFQTLSNIGEFWKTGNEEQINYLENRVRHYQRALLEKTKPFAEEALLNYANKLQQVSNK